MNWDFRLIYSDKKLTLYSDANDVIFTYVVDLAKTLETYTTYARFTRHMIGNRREFICFRSIFL